MSEVARWVARLNVEIFRKKLAEETDESRRQTLLCLLGEEEAELETRQVPLTGYHQRRMRHNVSADLQVSLQWIDPA